MQSQAKQKKVPPSNSNFLTAESSLLSTANFCDTQDMQMGNRKQLQEQADENIERKERKATKHKQHQ